MDRSGMGLATLASAAGQRAAVPPLREPVTLTMADMGMGAMDGANGGAFSHDAHAGMPGMDQDSGPGAAMIHGAMDHSMRSEEHTSELQSLMRISYAVFCLKKNNTRCTQKSM